MLNKSILIFCAGEIGRSFTWVASRPKDSEVQFNLRTGICYHPAIFQTIIQIKFQGSDNFDLYLFLFMYMISSDFFYVCTYANHPGYRRERSDSSA